tara:strand:+ start:2540 stop:2752 length:213 start_codon:yes stop_codon:yes gene_type:complete
LSYRIKIPGGEEILPQVGTRIKSGHAYKYFFLKGGGTRIFIHQKKPNRCYNNKTWYYIPNLTRRKQNGRI